MKMMTNLFSTFDPSTSMSFSLNWLNSIFFNLYLPNMFWLIPSRYNMMWITMNSFVKKEMKVNLNKFINKVNIMMFNTIFTFITLNNFMGLFPYIFTSSSHMTFSLSLAMYMWCSFMMFGWMFNYKYMLIHLTPQGTPNILMPFMVLIETISNLIRPITLAIRLSANIIAGHLLISLISSSTNSSNSYILILIIIILQTFLMSLEIAVSIIQGYVFTILSTIYSSETN
uniref:ATP synthase subunit a n=1 Tax=Vanhornia eucnemidarum TaxID=32432 RepID=Q0H2F8_9HYME|nr:ATP synthase subunit 6 [Vanhornia eucnemidarum]